MQANTTKRTGAKLSPKDFLSLMKKPRDHRNIKPSVSFKLTAAVPLQAAEYCASSSNCYAFRDFSRVLFLEIRWISASFSQMKTRLLCESVRTAAFYYEV